ncbi:hypothetical protein ERX46_09115 [Brumimicrobium glaciale]|uniref:Lipoprotein n=1 Tax=Brumimicrobium glaciale TaxID=200475 RepID=A0A4Q4KQ17_9FLAO|nr:hypothetical protein [Brumimicrobium glaciale]RYM34109.1 hypothetical protein ERX46_09115 [Brumimicrobium glaciale]
MKNTIEKIIFATVIILLSSCGSIPKEKVAVDSKNKQFIWDFSKEKIYVYSYTQAVETENKMSKSEATTKTFMTGKGNLNVQVKPNNLADLSLTNLKLSMIMFNKDGTPRDTMTNETAPTVAQDMRPNGSFDEPNSNTLFNIVFPLPSIDLKEGQSDKIPMKIPFNANGSVLFSKGFNTLTFVGFKTIQDRKCAVLEGIIDISKLEKPEELKGEYKSATTGNASYYFDIDNHCYVGADIHIIMTAMMNTESESQDSFGMYIEMKSDNVFKIRLERIVDSKYQTSDQKNTIVQNGSLKNQSKKQLYEIGVMDRNGTDAYFYFSYQVPEKTASDQSKINFINKRLGEEIAKIADENTISDLVKMIDSIGPKMESEIELKNLEVLKIGVSENWRKIIESEVGNSDRVETIEKNEFKNYFSAFNLRTNEKLKSDDLSITVKSKFDSDAIIWFNVYYFNKVIPDLPTDSLQKQIKDTIIHSLGQFELYDLWVSQRDSMETIMNEVYKLYYPETSRVVIFDIVIPEEAEIYFEEIYQSRKAIMAETFENIERLVFLKKELESNNELTETEIIEIEKEIEKLERERKSIREKSKRLTYEYKPK